jgi:hypothetical protein
MAAKGGGLTPAEPARPTWLPEKFKTPEDMATSYAELEKKLGTPAPVVPAVVPPVKPANPLEIPATTQAAGEAVTAAGLDMAALQSEFTEHGDLTPETYTKLAASGIPKPMVEAYISGQKALAAQYDASAFEAAGGQEAYVKMATWAKDALPAEEKAAFNKAVVSGDKATMQLAIRSLKSQYEANFGQDPSLAGGGKGGTDSDVYTSSAQMTADMKKPEYKTDPAFRARVAAKIGRSTDMGFVTNLA